VLDAEGEVVGETETDEDGRWTVELEEPGSYQVVLDEDTLPDDVEIAQGRAPTVTLLVTEQRTPVAAFPLTSGDGAGGPSQFEKIAQAAFNGLKFGLIIAMTAVGLSLVFGITRLVNFAHGELVTFGAITAYFLNQEGPELHLLAAAVLAVAIAGVLGGTLELSLWRPLRRRGTSAFAAMVISIGLALAGRQALLLWFGSSTPRYRNYTIQERIDLGPISATPRDLFVMAISTVVLVGVGVLLLRTRVGRATRAVADSSDLAESSGVDVDKIVLGLWIVSAALAALGGVLQATVTAVNYLNGSDLLLLMFAGVVLGGLGTAYGAVVGSIAVGLATEVSTVWISPELKYTAALVVLIGVLLVRPQGLLGSAQRVA
jgi:branched-chain amino acid transport system permease protein